MVEKAQQDYEATEQVTSYNTSVDSLPSYEEVDISFFLNNDFDDNGELIESKEDKKEVVEEESEEVIPEEESEEIEEPSEEEELEEEESKDDDSEEEEKEEKKEDKSAVAKFWAKKERAIREKEKEIKELEKHIASKEQQFLAQQQDEEFVKAAKLKEILKNKNIGAVWEMFGIDELAVLKHYGIEDKNKAKETAEMAKVRAEREAIQAERKRIEEEQQKIEQQRSYEKAKNEIESVISLQLPEQKHLKAFPMGEVYTEVEAGVVKWINTDPSITSQLTFSQMAGEVLKHLDKVWGKRAELIISKKQAVSDKKAEAKKASVKASQTKPVAKAKKPTLSNKTTTKKVSTEVPTEWSPEVGDDFEEAVFAELFGK
jgi:hypothetical protein